MVSSKWLIFELNESAGSDYHEIAEALVNFFGDDADFFIPIHHEQMGSYVSKSVLMEGYVFVRDTPEIREVIPSIREQRVLVNPLFMGGKLQTVDSHTIGALKRKLKNSIKKKIQVGTQVEIMEGVFKKLTGEVMNVHDGGKKMTVKIHRLSREIIAPLPTTSVREVGVYA